MSEYAPLVFWVGFFGAPLIAYMLKGSLTDNGAILLGAIIMIGSYAVAMALNVGACRVDWLGGTTCNTTAENKLFAIGAIAGTTEISILCYTLYRMGRGRRRRALLVSAAALSAVTFAPSIVSIGVFLILGSWALFVWLAFKDPALRENEVPTSDPPPQGED